MRLITSDSRQISLWKVNIWSKQGDRVRELLNRNQYENQAPQNKLNSVSELGKVHMIGEL